MSEGCLCHDPEYHDAQCEWFDDIPTPPPPAPAPVTTHRAELEYGPPVVDGELRYLSASTITKADARSYGGCLRRWWYRYVGAKPEPGTKAMAAGTQMHAQIEGYLRTGVKALGPLAMTGAFAIPTFGPGYEVEHALESGVLRCAGVPVVGHIDLIYFRRDHPGVAEFTTHDPEGSVEVRDWKSTSNIQRYAKTRDELRDNVQMLTYGEYAARRWTAPSVRLTHVYFQKGSSRAAVVPSVLMQREEIAAGWEQIEIVGRSIREAARATRAEDVPANRSACGAYGGCPHRTYCRAGTHDSLAAMLGADTAQRLLAQTTGETEPMSLLAKLNAPKTSTPAPEVEIDLLAAMDDLAAEEQAAQAPAVTAEQREAYEVIERAMHNGEKFGWPAVVGEAAKIKAAITGVKLEGEGFAGAGPAAKVQTLRTADDMAKLAAQLIKVGKSTPTPAKPIHPAAQGENPLLPPDAPVSDPALAADPVEGFETPAQLGAAVFNAPPAPAAADAPTPKRRGRPPGAGKAKASTTVAQVDRARDVVDQGYALEIYLNAIPSGPFDRLEGWVEEIALELAKTNGTIDVRLGGSDSPIGFGKWRGALAAWAREHRPAPGTYVIIAPDEVAEVAVRALRGVADLFVEGVR